MKIFTETIESIWKEQDMNFIQFIYNFNPGVQKLIQKFEKIQ